MRTYYYCALRFCPEYRGLWNAHRTQEYYINKTVKYYNFIGGGVVHEYLFLYWKMHIHHSTYKSNLSLSFTGVGFSPWMREIGNWLRPRKIWVFKIRRSDSTTAKRSSTGVKGSWRWPYKRMSRVKVAMSAKLPWVPSIGLNRKSFIGNFDVSIWVQSFQVGPNTSLTTVLT